ncbi:emp24/gp25L/p24 family/GOLD-domain-containing protein [Catenaria anguillulae PL171]|uniref:Emp24/gp25L/p24 family/GOLD-domain-containing protein n=1 Tax=Catenaria anguillulae PL171 TaxID=765915 RepID=A0A1Y2HY82_9FUNG|nr:emp24/gp25L/p24 family/GOLD-domain-containing protein [Catenaria anguillulae PL171]
MALHTARLLLAVLVSVILLPLVWHARPASATAITVPVAAAETACYYVLVPEPGKKVSFYFAVQTGGDFDVDFLVSDPDYHVVVQGEKERQGDYVFAAQKKGEYSFCFSNSMSSFADKVVDLELSLEGEHESRAKIPEPKVNKQNLPDTAPSEEILYRISTQLNSYSRSQKFYHTRERRSFDTVKSTERRVWWLAVAESCLMVAMSAGQVWAVHTFFKGYGRGKL